MSTAGEQPVQPEFCPFPLQLVVREHRDGRYTCSVIGDTSLSAYGGDLQQLREELELLVGDRIERSHPSLLARFSAHKSPELEQILVPDVLRLYGDTGRATLKLTALSAADRRWTSLWIPRLDARLWLQGTPSENAGKVTGQARELAVEIIGPLAENDRLKLRAGLAESVEILSLRVRPASIASFATAGAIGTLMLPVPEPDRERDERRRRLGKWVRSKTPTLRDAAMPLHEHAQEGLLSRAWESDDQVASILALLMSDRPQAVVLVGPAGVGKSVLIDELAHHIAKRQPKPNAELDKSPGPCELWFCDSSRLVASSGMFGAWQQRIIDVIAEAVAVEAVLCLGSVVELLDAGRSAHSDQNAAQILEPVLGGHELRAIGEATDEAWARLELRNPSFARQFVVVRVADRSPEDVRVLVDCVAAELENVAKVQVDGAGRDAVVELSRRYGARQSSVGKSLSRLRRLVHSVAAQRDPAAEVELIEVGRTEVVQAFCRESGMPEFLVRDDVPVSPDALRDRLKARIVGQDHAVDQLVDLVARVKSGLAAPDKPAGSFLFMGPTGVGKTETVKALADLLFGSERRIVRLDMSEYAGPDCLARLLDPDSGLVAKVAQQPFSVVLLDELEKAHSAVFDTLLQVLGEARLTDGSGRVADFSNAVFLMTSNLGIASFRRPTGFGVDPTDALTEHLQAEVRRFFRPELVNRIDQIVRFDALNAEAIARIAERELSKLHRRAGLAQRSVALEMTEPAVTWLTERGIDPRYGARPLKRCIERDLVAPLSRFLSHRSHTPPKLKVDLGDGALAFSGIESSRKTTRGDAATLVAEMADLRWRIQSWLGCSEIRALGHEVQLVDRLGSTDVFWRDKEAANQRLQALAPRREVLDKLTELASEVDALEELAHEMYGGFCESTNLSLNVLEHNETLDDLAWDIYSWRWPPQTQVAMQTLVLPADSKLERKALTDVLTPYLSRADSAGWQVHMRLAKEGRWGKSESWSAGTALAQFTRRMRLRGAGTMWALVFEGPGVVPWLVPETGVHRLIVGAESADVHLFCSPGGSAPQPKALVTLAGRTSKPLRTHHHGKHQLLDRRVRSHRNLPGIGALPQVVAELIGLRMLADIFGQNQLERVRPMRVRS